MQVGALLIDDARRAAAPCRLLGARLAAD